MRRETRAVAISAMLTAVVALSGAASAQINPFRERGPKLTDADVQRLMDSTTRLNNAASPAIGQSESWSDPKTGARGTTSLIRIFQSGDMTCHALRYQVSPNATRPLRTYNLDWCKTPSGEWKIKS